MEKKMTKELDFAPAIKIREPHGAAPFMGLSDERFGGLRFMQNHMTFEAESGAGNGGGAGDEAGKNAGGEEAGKAAGKEQKTAGQEDKKPSDAEARLLKEVMAEKKKAQEANERLKAFEGLDPKEVRELVENHAKAEAERVERETKAEEERLKAAGDYEALRARMASEHEKAVKKHLEEAKGFQTQISALQNQIVDLTVGSNFANSKFVREDLILTPSKSRTVYGSYFDVVDGKVQGFDKPRGAADRKPLVNAAGESLSFDDALKAIVTADPEHESLLRNKTHAGTGTRSTDTNTEAKPDKMFGRSRIAAGLAAKKG